MGRRLEAACLQSRRDIHTEMLGKAGVSKNLAYVSPSEQQL